MDERAIRRGLAAAVGALCLALALYAWRPRPPAVADPEPAAQPTPRRAGLARVALPRPAALPARAPRADEPEVVDQALAETIFNMDMNDALHELQIERATACRVPQPILTDGSPPRAADAWFRLVLDDGGLRDAQLEAVDGLADFEDSVLDCLADAVWSVPWPASPGGEVEMELPLRVGQSVSMTPEELDELREKMGSSPDAELRLK